MSTTRNITASDRSEYPRQGQRWKQAEAINLRYFYEIRGLDYELICDILGRKREAIRKKALQLRLRRPTFYLERFGSTKGQQYG